MDLLGPLLPRTLLGALALALSALASAALALLLHRVLVAPLWLRGHYAAQGVRGSPFVLLAGDLPHLAAMRRARAPFLEWFRPWDEGFGRVSWMFLGPDLRLRVAEPELVQGILVAHAGAFEKTALMKNAMGRLLGDGLLLSEGATHRAHRALVSPAFTFARLRAFVPLLNGAAARAVRALLAEGARGAAAVPFHERASGLTLWIIALAAFGVELPGLLPPPAGAGEALPAGAARAAPGAGAVYDSIAFLMTAFVENVASLVAFLPKSLQALDRSAHGARVAAEIAALRALVAGIIAARRAARAAARVLPPPPPPTSPGSPASSSLPDAPPLESESYGASPRARAASARSSESAGAGAGAGASGAGALAGRRA